VSYAVSNVIPASGIGLFVIDPRTGELRLKGPLDFEDDRLYEIQVEAKDMGTPMLSGHCSVELQVLDVND
ncbi:PCDA2 protein, partial [Crypturellus undulatus]|nr:PCDA2 protein [Crypturellus undulatus]